MFNLVPFTMSEVARMHILHHSYLIKSDSDRRFIELADAK